MWAWRMAALTGDARYGDVLEQVLYKWLEAMAHVYGATCDPELHRQMDEVIG